MKNKAQNEFFDDFEVDVHELIRRLRSIFGIDRDVELADVLGFENRNQITMYKLRNQITATGWNRIILVLNRPEYRFINLNELLHGLARPKLKKIDGDKDGSV